MVCTFTVVSVGLGMHPIDWGGVCAHVYMCLCARLYTFMCMNHAITQASALCSHHPTVAALKIKLMDREGTGIASSDAIAPVPYRPLPCS